MSSPCKYPPEHQKGSFPPESRNATVTGCGRIQAEADDCAAYFQWAEPKTSDITHVNWIDAAFRLSALKFSRS
jgi:hypothetical protein